MRQIRWILVAVAVSALALPIFAEEILYFKSGSAMPVVSHKIDGEMIHVDLGDNAFMAFPLTMIDRVERAGKNVLLQRSITGGTNVMQPARPDPTGSFPVRGSAQSRKDDRHRFDNETEDADPLVEMDASGSQVYRPWGNSSHPGKARVGLQWHQRILDNNGAGYRGATPIGTRHVIGSTVPRARTEDKPPPKIVGLKPREAPLKARHPNPQGGDSGSQSGSNDSGSEQ